jgi:hypothetical protein
MQVHEMLTRPLYTLFQIFDAGSPGFQGLLAALAGGCSLALLAIAVEHISAAWGFQALRLELLRLHATP